MAVAMSDNPTFEEVDQHIQSADLSVFQVGRPHMRAEATAASPAIALPNVCYAYQVVKPILALVSNFPLPVVPNWNMPLSIQETRSLYMKHFTCLLTVISLLITSVFMTAAPALGCPAPLEVTIMCESGESKFICDAYVTGGADDGSDRYEWVALSNATITRGKYEASVGGTCIGGKATKVRVIVKDSAGNVAELEHGFICNNGLWP
jgi:hypothetical protein